MAASSLVTTASEYCMCDIKTGDNFYRNVHFSVLPSLCSDVILGHPFLKQHNGVFVDFGGLLPTLNICASVMTVEKPFQLFANLREDCHPIATKSRTFNSSDRQFILSQVQKLLSDGVIEPPLESPSPDHS